MKQNMIALNRANEIRLERSRIKKDVKAGIVSVIDILETKPFVCDSLILLDLLTWQIRWGKDRARRFCNKVEISEIRTLGALTDRQINLIIGELHKMGVEAYV